MTDKIVTIEVYEDKSGKNRWRAVSGNNEQLARSPSGYKDLNSLYSDISYIASEDFDADLYKDSRGEWRWRFKRDGKIIAIASEGYINKTDCKYASDLLLDAEPV